MSEIVLVRHGETEWSRSGQHTGVTDLPLLPEGEEQALHGRAEARRARVRARPHARRCSAPAAPPSWPASATAPRSTRTCASATTAIYEGRTTKEIRVEQPGWDVWRDDMPEGETLDELAARADRVIERALAADGDTLVFAHSHLLRELGARWIGLAPDGGGKLTLGTAAVCVLGFERERRVLRAWNV